MLWAAASIFAPYVSKGWIHGTSTPGVQFGVTFGSTIVTNGAPAGFEDCVYAALAQITSICKVNVTVNLHFEYSGLGPGASSVVSSTNLTTYSYVKGYLQGIGAAGSEFLPASAPGGYGVRVDRAHAKALGIIPSDGSNDGTTYIGISSAWSTDTSGVPGPTEYPLFATVQHEATEIMGRVSYVTSWLPSSSQITITDFYRYDQLGARNFGYSDGSQAWLSLDGSNLLRQWNNVASAGDVFDWTLASADMATYISPGPGIQRPFTDVDKTWMDAIGWKAL